MDFTLAHTAAIGFLGGTFDPPHAGHIALAQAARNALHLNQLRFIPTGQPWQKPQVSAAMHRLRMTELALAELAIDQRNGFMLDAREVERGDASYTIDTLTALRRELGPSRALVWIMGSDQLERLHTWHQWQKLLEVAHLAVVWRNGVQPQLGKEMRGYYEHHRATVSEALQSGHGCFIDITMAPVDISATALRALLARDVANLSAEEHEVLTHSLAPKVLDYIRAHSLYSSRHTPF